MWKNADRIKCNIMKYMCNRSNPISLCSLPWRSADRCFIACTWPLSGSDSSTTFLRKKKDLISYLSGHTYAFTLKLDFVYLQSFAQLIENMHW